MSGRTDQDNPIWFIEGVEGLLIIYMTLTGGSWCASFLISKVEKNR